MATFVNQEISPSGAETRIFLNEHGVFLYDGVGRPVLNGMGDEEYSCIVQDIPWREDEITAFIPGDREQANQMSIAFRLAAKRLEEIGKSMSNGGKSHE